MVNAIAEKIYGFVIGNISQTDISDVKKQVCQYGIELIVATIINFICIIGIGALFGRTAESIVFLIVFSTLRQFTGGYHANTYLKCNSIFMLSFLCILFLSQNTANFLSDLIAATVLLVSLPIIITYCPVEHPDKPIDKRLNMKCKLLSTVLWIVFGVTSVIMIRFNWSYGILLFYTLLLVETLIVVVKIKNGGVSNVDKRENSGNCS